MGYNIHMKRIRIVTSLLATFALFFAITAPIASVVASTCASGQICNPIKYDDFSEFVLAVTNAAVDVIMPFVFIAFIYTGFLFVRAQGKPDEIKKAQQSLMWSVIGAAILLGAWGFSQIIESTLSTITTTTQ